MTGSRGQRRLQARGLVVRRAGALTLLLVIVFPGLAVVGLAALRLALLACAKHTNAVRPPAWPLTPGPGAREGGGIRTT